MPPFSAQKLNELLDEFINTGGIENLESYHQQRLVRRQKFTELLQAPKLKHLVNIPPQLFINNTCMANSGTSNHNIQTNTTSIF